MAKEVSNLQDLLDRMADAAKESERVCIRNLVEAVGARSFGPLLLMVGIILVSPLSGVPGMPTSMGLIVLLTTVQMLLRRNHFWLPNWLLNRCVARSKVEKALKWLRPPARFIDRWLRQRLLMFVRNTATYVVAMICLLIGAGIPVMELVPFAATGAGVALTCFGLALIACDGLLALVAFIVTGTTFVLIIRHLLERN